jgi:type II secretory pathway predicted ATPase ExeA
MRMRTPLDWRRRRAARGRGNLAKDQGQGHVAAKRPPNSDGQEWLLALLEAEEPQPINGPVGGHGPGGKGQTTSAMRRLVPKLLSGLAKEAGVFLLTGPRGVGKSFFLRHLSRELRAASHLTVPVDRPGVLLCDVLQAIAAEIKLAPPVGDAVIWFERVHRALASRKNTSVPVLLLDDGDLIRDPVLLGLLPLLDAPDDRRRGFRVVIAGRPEMTKRLEAPALACFKQKVVFHRELEAFDANDILHLIRTRARPEEIAAAAGTVIKAVCDHADGLPGEAMWLWAKAHELARDESQRAPSVADVERAARMLRPTLSSGTRPRAPEPAVQERTRPAAGRAAVFSIRAFQHAANERLRACGRAALVRAPANAQRVLSARVASVGAQGRRLARRSADGWSSAWSSIASSTALRTCRVSGLACFAAGEMERRARSIRTVLEVAAGKSAVTVQSASRHVRPVSMLRTAAGWALASSARAARVAVSPILRAGRSVRALSRFALRESRRAAQAMQVAVVAARRDAAAALSTASASLPSRRVVWRATWAGCGVAAAASVAGLLFSDAPDPMLPKLAAPLTTAATQHDHDTPKAALTARDATVGAHNMPSRVEVALDPWQSSIGEASSPPQVGLDRPSGELAEIQMVASERSDENTAASASETSSALEEAAGASPVGASADEQETGRDFAASAGTSAIAPDAPPDVPGTAEGEDVAATAVAARRSEPASPTPQPSAAPEQRIAESDESRSSTPDQTRAPTGPQDTQDPPVVAEESTDDSAATTTALNEPPLSVDRASTEPEPPTPSPSEQTARVEEKPVERVAASTAPAEQSGHGKAGRTHHAAHPAKKAVHALEATKNKSGEARQAALHAPAAAPPIARQPNRQAAAPPASPDEAPQPPLRAPVELAMATPPALAPQRAGEPQCVSYRSNVNYALDSKSVHGKACRGADGKWWLVDQQMD